MKNELIGGHLAVDLDQQVLKVLRGLDFPEPPLHLRDVRALLELDLHYYSSTDDSALRETISRMKVAGKQILERPSLILDAVRTARLKALWLPDHRRILIDQDEHELKHRWNEGHEIAHSLAPWHRLYLFGDSAETLLPTCHEKLENEANYTCGQLLFLGDRFTDEAREKDATLETVRTLSKEFGNTITSTLWRFVERGCPGVPMVGIVSQHPYRPEPDFDPGHPCRYCVESPEFKQRFGSVTELQLFELVLSYCTRARGGPLGNAEVLLRDRNGDRHEFAFESFSNTHQVLTLGVYRKPAHRVVSVL
jgi:Zn-dependent peptidase ImmA (M78 family)